MKIRQEEPSCSMGKDGWTGSQSDRQTNMTKLIVTFLNFVHAPKTNIYVQKTHKYILWEKRRSS
jgi:hypothetical protein